MSSLKANIDCLEVEKFLIEHFSVIPSNIEILKGGEISQSYSFSNESGEYVIKIRKVKQRYRKRDPFRKEIIISEIIRNRQLQIPVPSILQHGIFRDSRKEKLIYGISEKASGEFVHLYSGKNIHILDNNLVEFLFQIHSIDITNTRGYGYWEKWNEANAKSMQKHIFDTLENQKIHSNKRFSSGIFEKELYIQGSRRILELLDFCSVKRYLVHGDYGYDNVLTDKDGNITAIYDWENSIFGDFVYDLAWLDFWGFREDNTYSNLYLDKFGDYEFLDFNNYEERLYCYKLFIGMIAAGFFSESKQLDKYLSAKERILKLI